MVAVMTACVTFVGVSPGAGTTTLAINMAALLGVVARQKTLLLDTSGNRRGICYHLGVPSTGGLLALATPWLRNGCVSADKLVQQVVHYEPGRPWPPGVSALDILPGFDRDALSPTEADRIFAYRGIQLVHAVCQAAQDAGYEFVLLDNGDWKDSSLGVLVPGSANAMVFVSEHVILVSSSSDESVRAAERFFGSLRAGGRSALIVFNRTKGWSFRMNYEDLLKRLPHRLVPSAEKAFWGECEVQRTPAVLCGAGRAPRQRDGTVKALIDVARDLFPQVKQAMRDSQGRPL
jgi:cellulose biosynthesis protein BcsQ